MFEILDDLATRSSELESHMTSLEYAIIHFPLAKLCSTPSVVQNNVDQEIYEHFMVSLHLNFVMPTGGVMFNSQNY